MQGLSAPAPLGRGGDPHFKFPRIVIGPLALAARAQKLRNNMRTVGRSCRALIVIAACMTAVPSASVQDSTLATVEDLYTAAAYEEALAALDRFGPQSLQDAVTAQSVRHYRALCLLALGRSADAEQSVEEMVRAEPSLRLSDTDAPPRLVAIYKTARRRVLPSSALQQYSEAKAQFEAHDYASAAERFERLMSLLDDPELKASADAQLVDIGILASGFLQLARIHAPVRPLAPTRDAPPASEASGASAVAITPPQTVRQHLPAWREPLLEGRTYTGIIEITISQGGDVVAVRFVKSIHPAYDGLLEQAAKSWKYLPAMKDSRPVVSTKSVRVTVSPHR